MQQAKRRKQDPETLASVLELAQRDVLPDEVLENYVDLKLFTAIRKEMLQRHERQSQYLIRAWLGLQEFCQNPLDLEVGTIQKGQRAEPAELKSCVKVEVAVLVAVEVLVLGLCP